MKTIEEVVRAFNQQLSAQMPDYKLLEHSVSQFAELCEPMPESDDSLAEEDEQAVHPGIVLMDFKEHSEEKREEARLLKLENVKQQNYELAANLRDVEKACNTYLEFKKHYGLETSAFVLLHGFLIYTYFGDAPNDEPVREFLEKKNCLKNMKICYGKHVEEQVG